MALFRLSLEHPLQPRGEAVASGGPRGVVAGGRRVVGGVRRPRPFAAVALGANACRNLIDGGAVLDLCGAAIPARIQCAFVFHAPILDQAPRPVHRTMVRGVFPATDEVSAM